MAITMFTGPVIINNKEGGQIKGFVPLYMATVSPDDDEGNRLP